MIRFRLRVFRLLRDTPRIVAPGAPGFGFLVSALVILSILGCQESVCQEKPLPLFPNQARVCFVGNSITQSGGYHHYIHLFHVTRFPNERVAFFNCGVGGDVASKILRRAEEDIFIHEPDHLVLMVGMNDVNRPLYASKHAGDQSIDAKKAQMFSIYRRDTEELVRRFKQYTPNVVLIKPSIYDQTAQLETENLFGANDALRVYGNHLDKLAEQYDADLVDFWTILNNLNEEGQRKDPAFTIVSADRIHPKVTGHFVMAYQFLKTLKAFPYVARMAIPKDGSRSNNRSINCEISNLTRTPDVVSFVCKAGSLPFPAPTGSEEAYSLVPFNGELNKEILQIEDLHDGDYDVRIDSVLVGTYTSKDLREGVNIALCKNSPQYQQALKVMEKCLNVWRLQANLRLLKRVEYVDLAESERGLGIDSIGAILNARLQSLYLHDRYEFNQKMFSRYMDIKPRADEIRDSIRISEDVIFKSNAPLRHVYEVRRRD